MQLPGLLETHLLELIQFEALAQSRSRLAEVAHDADLGFSSDDVAQAGRSADEEDSDVSHHLKDDLAVPVRHGR